MNTKQISPPIPAAVRYVLLQILVLIGWVGMFVAARSEDVLIFVLLTIVSVVLIIGYLTLSLYTFRLPEWTLWATLVVISAIQNPLIGLIVSDKVTVDKGRVLIGLQFLYILIILIITLFPLLFRKNVRVVLCYADIGAFLFIAIMSIEFLISEAPITARLANLRNMLGGTFVYLAIRNLPINARFDTNEVTSTVVVQLKQFISFLGVAVSIIAIIGIVEFIADSLWDTKSFYLDTLNAGKVFLAKLGSEKIPTGIYYTYILDYKFNRLLSVYYEAINASYFFAATTIVLSAMGKWQVTLLSTLALILTFGKGGFLIIFVTIYIYILERVRLSRMLRFMGYLLPIAGYTILAYVSIFLIPSSAESHFLGLSNGFRYALSNPFGAGLGFGGARGALEDVSFYQSGGESGIGFILFTTGFIGFAVWGIWSTMLLYSLKKSIAGISSSTIKNYKIVVFGMIFALTLVTFLQENALSTSANYLFFVFAAISIRDAIDCHVLRGITVSF